MLNYQGYTIRQFSVSKHLEDEGFNGSVIARKLEDHYLQLKDIAVSVKEDTVQAIGDDDQPELNVDVLGVGLSLRSIGFHLRDLLGRENNFIGGEIVEADDSLALTLRMSGADPQTFIESLHSGRRQSIERLLGRAAEQILNNTDPYRLALYYRHLGQDEKDLAVAQQMLIDHPSEEQWAYLAWGVNLENMSRYEEALSKYELSIAADPGFHLAWFRKGFLLRRMGKTDESIAALEKTVVLHPEYSNYWNSLANALYFAGRVDEAEQAFEKAEAYSGPETNWLFNWADKKVDQGKLEEALELMDRAIEKAERHGNVLEEIDARLFKAILEIDTARINHLADIKLAVRKDDIYNLGMIATAYFRAENYRRTIKTGMLAEGLNESPEQSQRIFNMVAMSYNFIGQPDSGLYYSRKAIAIDTTTGYPYSILAETYHYLGQTESFYKTLERAFQYGMSPGSISADSKPYDVYWENPRFKALLEKYRPANIRQ